MSAFIHAHVEQSGEETQCASHLCSVLERHGFRVRRGVANLETSFVGELGEGTAATSVALICEYDGLPPYGQSCGHNIVSAASVGAALMLAPLAAELDLRLVVMGTPAEESFGGKRVMADAGVFEGVDAALLIYPGMDDIAASRVLWSQRLTVTATGRAAHAAARPELGASALDAIVLGYSALSMLRQFLPSTVRVHAIINRGGVHPQVVPDRAEATVVVRANDLDTLKTVREKVRHCFANAGSQTGTRVDVVDGGQVSESLLPNSALAETYEAALRLEGRTPLPTDQVAGAWSTDAGYLSRFVPVLQPQLKLTSRLIAPHSLEFHDACIGMAADAAALTGARLLAVTAGAIAQSSETRKRIGREYKEGLAQRLPNHSP